MSNQNNMQAGIPATHDFLTDKERHTLAAVCDTICASLEPSAGADPGSPLSAYWRRSASEHDAAGQIEQALTAEVGPREKGQFRQALQALENPAACLLTTGSPAPFSKRTAEEKEALLLAWSRSPVLLIRQAFQTLKRLAGFAFYAAPGPGGPSDPNPNWGALGYPDPWRPPARPAPPANPDHPITPLTIAGDTVLEADACVVGSGAGGGVVAALLAQAGYRVVVLEAGEPLMEPDFNDAEGPSMQHMFARGGLLTTSDGGIIVLAGRTLGGGTTVNWMTCFRPPRRVLEQWAETSGISDLLGPELQASLDAVERRLHVDKDESHLNPNNAALRKGGDALGWHHDIQPRNALNCGDCGLCTFGCPWGAKQGTMRTYLQDAYDAGGTIVTEATAERILLNGKRAVGVEARVGPPGPLPFRDERSGSHRLIVRAPMVVVAGGAIESPALLLRSGLGPRLPALGRNLFLHPATAVIGLFEEDIAAWSGPLQSAHSDQFTDLDPDGFGVKFETTPIYPGLGAVALPWEGARRYKERMLRLKHVVSLLVLTRDRIGGRVTIDRWGNPRIHYRPTRDNATHALRGCKEGARLLMAAGAEEIYTLHTRPVVAHSKSTAGSAPGTLPDPSLFTEFDRQVDRQGAGPNNMTLFSAHQMGTCRMGTDPHMSVVDSLGAVHGYTGLHVIDGSLFPLSSGVNPMISIMGLAHWIATRLARR